MDFRRFTRNSTSIRIDRYTGAYNDNGIYEHTLETSFEVIGTPMPYRTVYPTSVFEPERGQRVENRLILFLNEKLYLDDPTKTHNTSDLVVINDEVYKPVSVESWQFGGNCNHYRYVIRSFDGY